MTHNTREGIEKLSITEYRVQMLKEMKEALQNNLPFAVNTEFPSFMGAFEKMIDGYADKIQQSHHQELQKARAEKFVDGIIAATQWLIDNGHLKAGKELNEMMLKQLVSQSELDTITKETV
jgi:protein involved in ribonucleotide reduction